MRRESRVILVAEDEPVVRNFVQLALTRAGYKVIAACDGAEAMRLSRAFEGDIHLVLTDIKMPNMVGPALIDQICRERPDIRFLVMSGNSTAVELPETLRPDMLRKPFLPADLLERVAQALK